MTSPTAWARDPEREGRDARPPADLVGDVQDPVAGVGRDPGLPVEGVGVRLPGPPTWTTLVGAVHDEPLRPDSARMLGHQEAEDGNRELERGLSGHLPVPDRMEDWHWATSLNQARAVRFGIEHFRSWWPRCSGTVLWQLNDCWSVTSWAALDGAGRRKPLW